ncbi:MAG TPA: hypothetical protein VE998_03105 [Terriglobales bacterium]|nr:hypothetical protein [Terriglobales bacterium]
MWSSLSVAALFLCVRLRAFVKLKLEPGRFENAAMLTQKISRATANFAEIHNALMCKKIFFFACNKRGATTLLRIASGTETEPSRQQKASQRR